MLTSLIRCIRICYQISIFYSYYLRMCCKWKPGLKVHLECGNRELLILFLTFVVELLNRAVNTDKEKLGGAYTLSILESTSSIALVINGIITRGLRWGFFVSVANVTSFASRGKTQNDK